MNIYVSDAAISQTIPAIRFGTRQTCFLNPCPTCSVYRLRAAMCRISAHSCPSYASLAFAFLTFFAQSIYHQIAFETLAKNDVFFSSREAKTRKKRASGKAPPAGPFGAASDGAPSPAGGTQGSRRSRDHQCTGQVQCTGI